MTNVERLREKCKQLAADGVVDIKFVLADDLSGATLEEVAGEVLAMYDALERGETTVLTFNDSHRRERNEKA